MHRNENIWLKFTQLQGKIPYSEAKTGQFRVDEAGSWAALKKPNQLKSITETSQSRNFLA